MKTARCMPIMVLVICCGCDPVGIVEMEFMVTTRLDHAPVSGACLSMALMRYNEFKLGELGRTDENGRVQTRFNSVVSPITGRPSSDLPILVKVDDGSVERMFLLERRRGARSWGRELMVELVAYEVHSGWLPKRESKSCQDE